MLVVAFLCMSLWQSSHVHHQHGSEDSEITLGPISSVPGAPDENRGDTEPHGGHSHEAPDKTAHVYKHQTIWKTFRGKAGGDSKLKMLAVLCARAIPLPVPEASTIQAPYVMGGSGAWIVGRPPARAPPVIYRLA